MKKLFAPALVLAYILLLTSCSFPFSAPEGSASTVQDMEHSPGEQDEDLPQLSNQDLAQRAYGQILDSFGGLLPHDPGYPGYPDEFGDAYYEDGYIVVCLTDSSQEMQEKYRNLVDTPEILRFREVAYSYNDLYALQEAVSSIQDLNFASIGVNVMENQVEIGISDIAQEAQTLALILDQLPQDISVRFSEPPLVFREDSGSTTA